MLLSEAMKLFLSQYKESSKIAYGSTLNDLVRYYPAETNILDIRPIDLVQYMSSVWDHPEIKSPVTYNKYVKYLRTFFNWCVTMEMIRNSPAKALKKKNTRDSVPKSKAMPEVVIYRLIRAGEALYKQDGDIRPLALLRFLHDTGCRIGGAAGLTRDRLNLDKPVIRAGQRIYRTDLFEKGREDPNRYYFSHETAQVLRKLLLSHSGSIVFGNSGQPITGNRLGRIFRDFTKDAGCERGWGPHSLRHAKGHAVAKEFPLSIGARILNDTEDTFIKYYAPKDNKFVEMAVAEIFAKQAKRGEIINLNKLTG